MPLKQFWVLQAAYVRSSFTMEYHVFPVAIFDRKPTKKEQFTAYVEYCVGMRGTDHRRSIRAKVRNSLKGGAIVFKTSSIFLTELENKGATS